MLKKFLKSVDWKLTVEETWGSWNISRDDGAKDSRSSSSGD